MQKLLSIAKNTFVETLRQPVYAVIIVTALLLMCVSPSLTMYTMDDDNKLLREICLSTLFLASLFIAVFSASGAVAEELENKTILTVLTKPVQRPIFILAKFLGVLGAVALSHYICTIALLMAIRHGVLESASEASDWTVIAAGGFAVVLSLLLSAFFNYVYDWRFSSTAIVLLAVFGTVAMLFLGFIDRNWQFNPQENKINVFDIYASTLLLFASVIIVALAVMFSARFNIVVTLSACLGVFLMGLVTDHTFGKRAEEYLWAKILYFTLPNFQVFWITDAIHGGETVPLRFIAIAASYTACYTAAILLLATAVFQRRQVG